MLQAGAFLTFLLGKFVWKTVFFDISVMPCVTKAAFSNRRSVVE